MIFAALGATLTAALLLLFHNRQLVRERDAANAAARDAYERLVQARRDGFEVPDLITPAPSFDEEPLIPELETIISDWESEAAQQAQRKFIRNQLAKGKSQVEVLRYLEPRAESVPSDAEGAE